MFCTKIKTRIPIFEILNIRRTRIYIVYIAFVICKYSARVPTVPVRWNKHTLRVAGSSGVRCE